MTRKIPLSFAVTLVASAFLACGGLNKVADTITGKKEKVKPFKADATQLSGIWIINELTASYSSQALAPEDGANQEIWLFDQGGVSIYRPALATQNCKEERPFHVQGDDILVIEAKGACPRTTVKIVRLDNGILSLTSERTYSGISFSILTLAQQSNQAALTENLYSWTFDRSLIAPKLLPVFPTEVADADLASARDGFKSGLAGASATQGQSLKDQAFATVWAGNANSIVVVQHGVVILSTTLFQATDLKALLCVIGYGNGSDADVGGFKHQIATVQLSSAKQSGGVWTMTANQSPVTESTADNSQRLNKVDLGFVGDPGLTVECKKPRAAGVITYAEVQEALGKVVVLAP